MVPSAHGDVIATSDITGTATPAVGITGWVDQDEYGNPLPAGSAGSLTKGIGYGWVGAKQRATLDTGLLLMGTRIYNPAVGGFTSTDPVYGGGDTTYGYPNDPINRFDANGRSWSVVARFVVRYVVPVVRTSASRAWTYAAPRVWRSTRDMAGKLNFVRKHAVRIGRPQADALFRVSLGPARKYWKELGPLGRQIGRFHLHIDLRYGGFDDWVTARNWTFWRRS